MAELDSLINSKISLVSHEHIRYDGTLFSINQAESSLVLKDVRCYGTEDRVKEADKIIPGNDTVIPFVTFPGAEIMDLYVHEEPTPTPPPAPTAPVKPAPATSADVPPPAPAHKKPAPSAPSRSHQAAPKPQPVASAPAAPAASAPAVTADAAAPAAAPAAAANRAPRQESSAGTGSHLLRMKERKGVNDGTAPETTEGDFDFARGLKVFDKDALANLVNSDGKEIKAKYVKGDFFDNLTNDKSEGRQGGRLSAAEERHLNQDTFGAIALQSNRRGGGRGRGGRGNSGGRGGRGRGGGYGAGRGRGVPAVAKA